MMLRLPYSGALAIVIMAAAGCVGIPDFSQSDRNSFEKASRIITDGRIAFSCFDEEERLWCARNLTVASIIIDTLEKMSHPRRDPNASAISEGFGIPRYDKNRHSPRW